MSRYTSGWTWRDDAEEHDETNAGACDRISKEIAQLYNSVPDPDDERYQNNLDVAYEAKCEEEGHEAAKKLMQTIKNKISRTWGEIEALEEMLIARGGRLRDPYEHHNEFADQQRTLDNLADSRSMDEPSEGRRRGR